MILHIFFIIVGLLLWAVGLCLDSISAHVGALLIILNLSALLLSDNKKEEDPKVEQITAKTVQIDTLININKGIRDTTYVITKID